MSGADESGVPGTNIGFPGGEGGSADFQWTAFFGRPLLPECFVG